MHRVVDFNAEVDKLFAFDLTENNTELTADIVGDTQIFSDWVAHKLSANNCRYGIGGYNEHRTIYGRSTHFDTNNEPRRLHLGTDIWGAAGTPVYNFQDGIVHSFNFNDNFGDYGATVILKYNFQERDFHVLYGHLSLDSLNGLYEGETITAGKQFAAFGIPEENGYWPPHLHFQVILDMQGNKGDYPGVCRYSERADYLSNCLDPRFILDNTFGVGSF
ncbi:MAG: peptidase M23 [Pedobacter sp.]|nr:MAG: peptidase M23 [Pedobacter sp.]